MGDRGKGGEGLRSFNKSFKSPGPGPSLTLTVTLIDALASLVLFAIEICEKGELVGRRRLEGVQVMFNLFAFCNGHLFSDRR